MKHRTTYPPLQLTGDFTVNTTLSPQAQRDTDQPDRGYHYDPLDWCWSSLNLTNCSLLLTNGVAVGFYGTKGLTFRKGSKLTSEGTPTRLNRMVEYTAAQELPSGTTNVNFAFFEWPSQYAPAAEIRTRFTDLSVLAGTTSRRALTTGIYTWGLIHIQDSQWRGVYFDGRAYLNLPMNVVFINNIFHRGNLFLLQDASGYQPYNLTCYNNLFLKGPMEFRYSIGGSTWTVKDNLFDCDTLMGGSLGFTASHNGYRTGLTSFGGAGNKTGLTMDYVTGTAANWYGVLGDYYYPTTGANLATLIDAGSRNRDAAGLWHYTVKAAEGTKEGLDTADTDVDIGYHAIGLNATTHLPNDTDGDSLPDYFEDRNGNGAATPDSGETDWDDGYNSIYGLTTSPGLSVFTPLRP